jgi:Flp pilus assembly protein TadG
MRRERTMPRRGAVLVWAALLMGVCIALTGLVLDWAFSALVAHQLQNAADAAALAGAQRVRTDQEGARNLAVEVAAANTVAKVSVQLDRNDGNALGGDIVLGRFDRKTQVFEPDTENPNAVKAVARKTSSSLNGSLPLLFGPVYGVSTVEVSRDAIAMVEAGGGNAAVIALNNTKECGLDLRGVASLVVTGGDTQVNSDHNHGVCANGTTYIETENLNVKGEEWFLGSPTLEGELNTGMPQIPDPLGYLPEPEITTKDLGSVKMNNGTKTIGPGYYSGGISQTGGTLHLTPGIYHLSGDGLDVRGNGSFTAYGVMFHIVGKANVDLAGTGVLEITPPDPSNPDPDFQYAEATTYEGVSIFQARDNTKTSEILGTDLMNVEGALYFPSNQLKVGGTGDGFGNQLIADTLLFHGTGDMTIDFKSTVPAGGNRVFLVE